MVIINTEDGFSMVEIIVGIALAAIVAAIALPSWGKLLPNYALNNSTRQIQSELHNIKMRAAAENTGFQMSYLQGASGYTIERDAIALVTKPLPGGITITKEGTVSFTPRGTAGANRLRLRNAGGLCRQIVVSATGRIRTCTPSNCAEEC